MRKFIRRFGSGRGLAVCVLCLLVGLAGVLVLQTYASLTPEEIATQRYKELIAGEVGVVTSTDDLLDLWADEAWRHIETAIPGTENWIQSKGPCPVDLDAFPKTFLDNIIWYLEGESEVPVAEILIYQSRLDRTICVLNSDNKPIYLTDCPYGDKQCAADAHALERYPDLYMRADAKSIIAHLDVARVLLRVELIPSDRLYDYFLDEAKGGDDEKDDGKDSGGDGAKSGGGSNDFWIAINGPPQGVSNGVQIVCHLPPGFTNKIDIFTFDATTNNMFNGIQSDSWALSVTNKDVTGTNQFLWADTDIEDVWSRFYLMGSSLDEDGDALASAHEIFLHRTDRHDPDTDDDSLSDGWEVLHGLDPLDDGSGDPDNGAAGNPDDDDWSNFQEYNLGLNPVISNTVDSSNTAGLTVYVPSSL